MFLGAVAITVGDVEQFRQGVEVFRPRGGSLGLDHVVQSGHRGGDSTDRARLRTRQKAVVAVREPCRNEGEV